jgi:hypothetical protein
MLELILEHLTQIRSRTSMWVRVADVEHVEDYLRAFSDGCSIAAVDVPLHVFVQAAKSRGWKFEATGIVWHMREKGLSERAMIDEMISVWEDAFRIANTSSISKAK